MHKNYVQNLLRISLILTVVLFLSSKIYAQTDYIELYDKQTHFIDRMDIKLRGDSVLQFTTVKPFDRKRITERIEKIDSLDKEGMLTDVLTDIDRYNIKSLLTNNSEWTENYYDSFDTRKPILKYFFKNPSHLYSVDKREQYSLVIDPLMNVYFGKASGTNTFVNQRGIRIRGQLDRRFGFYLNLNDNQERDPLYVRDYTWAHTALPNKGYFKAYGDNGDGFDYFDIRGGITFHAGRYVDFQLGHDRFFIGNGYRTTFLSDFSAPYPFLKLNAQAGRFKYTAAVTQTIAPFPTTYYRKDSTLPRNYMMFHYLSWQPTNWLNVGFYENTMYNSKINGGMQVGYFNPVMFNRAYSSHHGNSAKSSIGLDFKANFAKHYQVYGQWLINEFHASKFLKNNGPWVNKFGWQIGGKYTDAFTIKNLDLQVESNFIRPFTYMDKWAQNNFLHYNQPLAHPLGANFKEFIGILKYQPIPKLYLDAKLIFYNKGLDSASYSYKTAYYSPNNGGDLFRNYNDYREADEGYKIGHGVSNKTLIGSFTASYEILQNLFFDVNATIRKANVQGLEEQQTKWISAGLRWNMARREFLW